MSDTNIKLLRESLEKKKKLLVSMEEVMDSQEVLLDNPEDNTEIFDAAMDELGNYSEELETIEDTISACVIKLKSAYPGGLAEEDKDKLRLLNRETEELREIVQKKISVIRDKTSEYFSSQQRDISSQRRSVEGIGGYFRSMGGLGQNSAYLDNKV